MADEPDTSESNDGGDDSRLELPKLGFRRRRKNRQAVAPAEEPARAATPEPAPEPVAETPVEAEVPPPAPAQAAPEPVAEPVAETPVEAEVPPPAPAQAGPEPEDDHTQVLPSAPEEHDGDAPDDHVHGDDDRDDDAAAAPEPKRAKRVKKPRRELTLPPVAAPVAAAVTGILVGLGIVALTFLSARGCQAVKGTSSCGGVGLFLLVAILVLAVLFGGALLRAWKIGDPLNSSFLAVGLVAVIAMLFFLSYIDQWWMVIVIPVISALAYLLSWWVTRTFISDSTDDGADEPVDLDKVGL